MLSDFWREISFRTISTVSEFLIYECENGEFKEMPPACEQPASGCFSQLLHVLPCKLMAPGKATLRYKKVSVSHLWLFQTPWTIATRLLCPWILQARILEWIAILFFRGFSQSRDETQVSYIAGRFLPSESPGKTSRGRKKRDETMEEWWAMKKNQKSRPMEALAGKISKKQE